MLRAATDDDKDLALKWRNHPVVRAVSLQQQPISEDEHAEYWASLKGNHHRKVYIYEFADTPAGVVTFFDIDDGYAMWGYYLDNDGLEARGQLLPAWIKIQREAVRLAFGPTDKGGLALDVLEGEVLEANEAVRSMNKRNGFEEIGLDNVEIDGLVTVVHRIRRTVQPGDR